MLILYINRERIRSSMYETIHISLHRERLFDKTMKIYKQSFYYYLTVYSYFYFSSNVNLNLILNNTFLSMTVICSAFITYRRN